MRFKVDMVCSSRAQALGQAITALEHPLVVKRHDLSNKHTNSDVPVISINTGSGGSFASDMASSYYGDMNEEIAKVCRFLREQDDLKGGFNMIGFSQGGQFSRAVVQRCRFCPAVCLSVACMGKHEWGSIGHPMVHKSVHSLILLLRVYAQSICS